MRKVLLGIGAFLAITQVYTILYNVLVHEGTVFSLQNSAFTKYPFVMVTLLNYIYSSFIQGILFNGAILGFAIIAILLGIKLEPSKYIPFTDPMNYN